MSDVPQFRKLSVLMPVYNERWTLDIIVERVLTSPVDVELELVMVDDCSTDGSWQVIERLAQRDSRIKAVRHAKNGGKGTAIRTAIAHMTGDVAVVQDADLEYDPHEFPKLLAPIVAGKADAVFGSRYAAITRKVPRYWHTQVNRFLTWVSNLLSGLLLTDMETCYKMVRADVLRNLHLTSATFTLEPEITIRLAQWGARIYEVPISYAGRSFDEGKKIRPIDGLKAIGALLRYRFWDRRFSTDPQFATLKAVDQARAVCAPILESIYEQLGARVLHLGPGLGTLAGQLLSKDRLILAEANAARAEMIGHRFSRRTNLSVERGSADDGSHLERWRHEQLDTVLITDWLAEGVNERTLTTCRDLLAVGGTVVVCHPVTDESPTASLSQHLRGADFDITQTLDLVRLPGWLANRLPVDASRRIKVLNRLWPLARFIEPREGVPMFRVVVAKRRHLQSHRLAA